MAQALHKPAVFLDRDGTLNEERNYVRSLAEFKLVPRLSESLKYLSNVGLELVVITNQSGVARGYLSSATLEEIHGFMVSELKKSGVTLAGIYSCIHHPDQKCACRKPAIGLIEKASIELGLDVPRSYVIGDRWSDVRLGRTAGCAASVLLENARYAEEARAHDALGEATYVATDLWSAAQWIGEHHAKTS